MSEKNEINGIIKKCPVCGKRFWMFDARLWVYKSTFKTARLKYFCSWTCLRKAEAAHVDRKKEYREGKTVHPGETILDRTTVLYLVRQTGKTLGQLSAEAGHGRGWLSRLTAHEPVRVRTANVEALARVLDCDPALIVKKVKQE